MVVTDGRDPSAMPEERIPRTVTRNRKKKGQGYYFVYRHRGHFLIWKSTLSLSLSLSLANKVGNVVTIFSSRELIKLSSELIGKVKFPCRISSAIYDNIFKRSI